MKDGHIISEKINDTLHVAIKKDLGKLNILLQNPQYITEDDNS